MTEPVQMRQNACQACGANDVDLSKEAWQQRYDEGKTGWDRGEANPWLVRLLDGEQDLKPGRMLVPGCGRGHEVIALAKAGFDVTAIDFADSAIVGLQAELTRRALVANVIQTDLFSFCGTSTFDAIYEQTCLCAIDPSQWQTYEQLLACWLRPGGMLYGLFMQSGQNDQPPFSCDLPAMRSLFREPDWVWTSEPERIDHPTGMHELACILRRAE